jgi:hypothetical protein
MIGTFVELFHPEIDLGLVIMDKRWKIPDTKSMWHDLEGFLFNQYQTNFPIETVLYPCGISTRLLYRSFLEELDAAGVYVNSVRS